MVRYSTRRTTRKPSGWKRRKRIALSTPSTSRTMFSRVGRALSSASSSMRRSVRSMRSSGVASGTAGTARAVVRKTKAKAAKLKKVKVVKISNQFRKKVDAAMKEKMPLGHFKEVHYGGIELGGVANFRNFGIDRTVQDFTVAGALAFGYDYQWNFGRTRNSSWDFDNFTFNEFLDATEVLFFNKINRLNSIITDDNNTEDRHRKRPSTDEFGLYNSKVRVVDSSVTYEMKNNSHRKYQILIYKCSPKRMCVDTANKGVAGDNSRSNALYDWWLNLQGDNQGNGALPNLSGVGIAGHNGLGVTPNATNLTGIHPNLINASPWMSEKQKSMWTIGCERIELEPGQCYTFVCHGPKNVMFEPAQWRLKTPISGIPNPATDTNNAYADMKPGFSQSMFFTIKPEVLTTGDGGVGVFGQNYVDGTLEQAITVQATKAFTIEMPETALTAFVPQTSTVISNPINYVPALNRKPSYFLQTWRSGAVTTDAIEIDVQNPGAQENINAVFQ